EFGVAVGGSAGGFGTLAPNGAVTGITALETALTTTPTLSWSGGWFGVVARYSLNPLVYSFERVNREGSTEDSGGYGFLDFAPRNAEGWLVAVLGAETEAESTSLNVDLMLTTGELLVGT